MASFLARGISASKWTGRAHIAVHEVPADAVTADMRTSDNTLSFWLYDPNKGGSLEDVALALASVRDNIQRLDLVWVEYLQIQQMNLQIASTPGDTPARHLRNIHRDVVGIDVGRLADLARGIAHAVTKLQVKRFTEKQIHDLLRKATRDKLISADDLKKSIAEKIQ